MCPRVSSLASRRSFRGPSTFETSDWPERPTPRSGIMPRTTVSPFVLKDSDFHQVSFLPGPPPKVVWIRRGHRTPAELEALLRSSRAEVLDFGAGEEGAFLALSQAMTGCSTVTLQYGHRAVSPTMPRVRTRPCALWWSCRFRCEAAARPTRSK